MESVLDGREIIRPMVFTTLSAAVQSAEVHDQNCVEMQLVNTPRKKVVRMVMMLVSTSSCWFAQSLRGPSEVFSGPIALWAFTLKRELLTSAVVRQQGRRSSLAEHC